MMVILTIILVAIWVSVMPISDVTTKRPVDILLPPLKKWWNSYPRYRIVETPTDKSTQLTYKLNSRYSAQMRRILSPCWSELDYHFSMDKAKKVIQTRLDDAALRKVKPIIHPIN